MDGLWEKIAFEKCNPHKKIRRLNFFVTDHGRQMHDLYPFSRRKVALP